VSVELNVDTYERFFDAQYVRYLFLNESFFHFRSLVEACNEGDISKVRKLLDEGRVSVHDTTEEGESLLSLACSAGYYELAQVQI